MMTARTLFNGIGVVSFLVGVVLIVVQIDQVLRTRAAVVRLREEVGELENIPQNLRNEREAMRFVQRKDDLRYFEEEAMPFDLALLVIFCALPPAGLACALIARILTGKRNRSVTEPHSGAN